MDPRTGHDPRARGGTDLRPQRPGCDAGRGPRQPGALRHLRAGSHQQDHDRCRGDRGGRGHPDVAGHRARRSCTAAARRSTTTSPHGVEHLTLTGVLAKSSNIGDDPHGAETDRPGHALPLPEEVRRRRPDRASSFPGESRGILPAPEQWSARSSTRSRSARDCRSTRCRRPRSTRRSPTTACASSLGSSPARRRRTARSPRQPRRRGPGSSARRPPPRSGACWSPSSRSRAPPRWRRSPATASQARPARRTGSSDVCHCYSGYTASFIGMAPADDPALVVAVTLQNPRNGHFGGRLAGPVFKQVMEFALATHEGSAEPGRLPARSRSTPR